MPTEEDVLDVLRQVIDPELGMNIVDLGLVYSVELEARQLLVSMTMTTPGCPLTDMLEADANTVLRSAFPDFATITVEIVWEPLWSPMMMSPAARQQMGW